MSANVRHQVSKKSLFWIVGAIAVGMGVNLLLNRSHLSPALKAERPGKIVEIVGQPALTKGVAVNPQPIQVGTLLSLGQQLTTQPGVRVAVQETEAEASRLDEQSSLTLEKDCLQLGQGRAVISGMTGCLGAVVVNGKQGIFTLERVDYLAEIKVLAGQVEVAVPRNPAAQSIRLQTGQKITIGLTGDEVGPVRLMLPSEVQQIVSGGLFQGFQTALPNQSEIAQLQEPFSPPPVARVKPSTIAPSPSPILAPSVNPTRPAIAPSPQSSLGVKPSVPAPVPSTISKPALHPENNFQQKPTPDCS